MHLLGEYQWVAGFGIPGIGELGIGVELVGIGPVQPLGVAEPESGCLAGLVGQVEAWKHLPVLARSPLLHGEDDL